MVIASPLPVVVEPFFACCAGAGVVGGTTGGCVFGLCTMRRFGFGFGGGVLGTVVVDVAGGAGSGSVVSTGGLGGGWGFRAGPGGGRGAGGRGWLFFFLPEEDTRV